MFVVGLALAGDPPPPEVQPLPAPESRYALRTEGLVGVIGGPALVMLGYGTFQIEGDLEKPPELFGLSAAAFAGGMALTAHGATALAAGAAIGRAAERGDAARLRLAVEGRRRRMGLGGVISGGVIVAAGAPFVAWAIPLLRQDRHDGLSALATGIGFMAVGGAQIAVGALRLEATPTVAWTPGGATAGLVARW